MPRSKDNLARHEWIGLEVHVEAATDPTLVGAAGRVVDETQGTLTIEKAGGREVRVPKAGTRASFALPGGEAVALDLTHLAYRPQDRTKRARLAKARAGA